MARRKGAFYFSLDVDFFKNRKTRILLGKYGTDGVILYLYLLCEIYEAGYYLKIDDDFEYIVAQDLNMSHDKIGQIMNFLCKRSLLDDTLFTSDKVLTSHRIQTTFQEINKGRAIKTPLEVEGKYWLLNDAETQPFIKVINFEENSEKNDKNSRKNIKNSEKFDTKKSKEKKSKINDSCYCNSDFKAIVNAYESNIGTISPMVLETLKGFAEEFGAELTVYAIEEAVRANARNIRYIEGIVKSWREKGITSVEGAKLATAEHRTKSAAMPKPGAGPVVTTKKNFFQDYDNEMSDFEIELMKQRIKGDAR